MNYGDLKPGMLLLAKGHEIGNQIHFIISVRPIRSQRRPDLTNAIRFDYIRQYLTKDSLPTFKTAVMSTHVPITFWVRIDK